MVNASSAAAMKVGQGDGTAMATTATIAPQSMSGTLWMRS